MDTAIYAIYNPGRFGGSSDAWSDKRDEAGSSIEGTTRTYMYRLDRTESVVSLPPTNQESIILINGQARMGVR
jgi:hypothetical protein